MREKIKYICQTEERKNSPRREFLWFFALSDTQGQKKIVFRVFNFFLKASLFINSFFEKHKKTS